MSRRKPASWVGRDLVVLEGGPLDPRWYFAEDAEATRASNRHQGLPFPYEPTGEVRPHPIEDKAAGLVWRRT